MRARPWLLLPLLTGWLGVATAGFADKVTLAVIEENDKFSASAWSRTDRHYTQGLKLALLFGPNQFTNLTATLDRWLPRVGLATERRHFGLILGQNIFTPENLLYAEPMPADRPYAGWLYTGAFLQRVGHTTAGTPVFENWELNLGIVGPESLADKIQSEVHRTGFPESIPQGWDNQLKTEPGFELKYARRWRYASRHADFIPFLGGSAGNIRVHANAGAFVRLGWGLPDDFGPVTIDSTASPARGTRNDGPRFGLYAVGGVEGRFVAHDLFLAGNTWRDSLGVEEEPWVADLMWGVGFHAWQWLEFSYTCLHRTGQFRGQAGPDRLGSFLVKATVAF